MTLKKLSMVKLTKTEAKLASSFNGKLGRYVSKVVKVLKGRPAFKAMFLMLPHLDPQEYKGFENKCLLIAYTMKTPTLARGWLMTNIYIKDNIIPSKRPLSRAKGILAILESASSKRRSRL